MKMLNYATIPLIAGLVLLSLCTTSVHTVSHEQQQSTVIRKYPFSPNCTDTDRQAIIRCEDTARSVWHIDDASYYTSTRSFCCFVWDTLSCALVTAQNCDPVYAAELAIVTEQTLESLCDYTAGSSSCTFPNWAWWPLVPIIIGCLTICGLVLYFAYPKQEHTRRGTVYDYEMTERK